MREPYLLPFTLIYLFIHLLFNRTRSTRWTDTDIQNGYNKKQNKKAVTHTTRMQSNMHTKEQFNNLLLSLALHFATMHVYSVSSFVFRRITVLGSLSPILDLVWESVQSVTFCRPTWHPYRFQNQHISCLPSAWKVWLRSVQQSCRNRR